MNKGLYTTVAVASRLEHEQDTDRVFIVFEIIDEQFKQKVKIDWVKDIDLILENKNLQTYNL